jgi:hypothetical protein
LCLVPSLRGRRREAELDSVSCQGAGRADRLLLDGLDWPHPDERDACNGLSRSSPARAIPSYILSPDYERVEYGESRGTWVNVYCPRDVPRICEGTIRVKVTGHTLGPKRFRVRPGRDREFEVAPRSYDDGECEDEVPARVERSH